MRAACSVTRAPCSPSARRACRPTKEDTLMLRGGSHLCTVTTTHARRSDISSWRSRPLPFYTISLSTCSPTQWPLSGASRLLTEPWAGQTLFSLATSSWPPSHLPPPSRPFYAENPTGANFCPFLARCWLLSVPARASRISRLGQITGASRLPGRGDGPEFNDHVHTWL